MNWDKSPLTRVLARSLRAGSRGIELDGHSFRYTDLRELWVAEENHVVLSHADDRSWQYWFHAPDGGGWSLVSVHTSRKAAQDAAKPMESHEVEPGTYVLARWDEKGRWMRVRCTSTRITEAIADIFTGLGCETRVEEVSAA